MRIRHVATCPEVAPVECATEDIPDHLHDQRISWFRLDPSFTAGLGRGWQVSAQFPVDLRMVRVAYTSLEGEPYDPPYADIHHRDETLWGPVDGTLKVGLYALAGEHLLVGGRLGTSVPIGRTEEDPYALGDAGLEHQHLQFGTGTFVPTGGVDLHLMGSRWGLLGWANGRASLYANGKGYRAPSTASLGTGPTFRLTPTVTTVLTVEGTVESAEAWNGDTSGGRIAGVGTLGVNGAVGDHLVLQAQGRFTLAQMALGMHAEEGTFEQPFVAAIGASWTFGAVPEEP